MKKSKTTNKTPQWQDEFKRQAEKYHTIGAWVAIVLNPLWAVGDYIEIPAYCEQFFVIRIFVAGITLAALLLRKKLNLSPEWLIFIPFLGIALQNAYMYSVMNVEELQKHTFAYIALFIGAGMLILWKPIYSFVVVITNLLVAVVLLGINSQLEVSEIMVNGGLLVLTVSIFTILLVHTRYGLTKKEIISRLALEESKKEIEQKNKDITDSIIYAKRIQEAILPASSLIEKYLKNYFILYIPRDIVCGDFYWFTHQKGKSFIAAVDCTGHGVPGAFMSMIGNTLLNEIVIEKGFSQPAIILDNLKVAVTKALQQSGESSRKEGMDIALCSIDHDNMLLEYAGAFNSLYLVKDNNITEIKANKQPIGQHHKDSSERFVNHSIALKKGDAFYIFSDGFADQFGGEDGRKYMSKNFRNFLFSIHQEEMSLQKNLLEKEFKRWLGSHNQIDDVLVIGVRA